MNFIYWIACLLFGIALAYLVYRKDKNKEAPLPWLPALLRAITASLAALLLLAPVFSGLSHDEEKPTLIWLQDISTSTKNALSGFEEKYQSQQKDVIAQLNKKYNVHTFGFGSSIIKDSINNYNQKATDIAAALEQISTQYQDKNLGAIILASDGIYNQGNNPSFVQFSKPINLYSIGLGDSTVPKDLSVMGAYANKTVALNNSFEIFADIVATGLANTQTTATLIHQGKVIASQNISINSNDFATNLSFATTAKQTGMQQYTISIAKTGEETNIQNNSRSVIVEVKERKTKILLLAKAPHPDLSTIKKATEEASQFELTTILNGTLPSNINDYDILIAYQCSPNQAVEIPTWYILGSSISNNELSIIKATTNTSIMLSSPKDILPQLKNGFSQFTIPSSIRATLPKMPPLNTAINGLSASDNTLITDQQGNAMWTYFPGSVPISILSGEGLWRWAMYEYKNFNNSNTTFELIKQTLSFLQIDKDNKPFKISVLKSNITDSEPAIVLAELRNNNGELINEPEAKLSLISEGKTIEYNFEKSGNAYRLQTALLAPGDYKLTGKVNWKGKAYEDHAMIHISNIPLEALRTHADYALMYQLANKNNGHFFTQFNFQNIVDSLNNNNQIKTIIHSHTENKPIIDEKWLFFLIIALASIEWFLRKIWNM